MSPGHCCKSLFLSGHMPGPAGEMFQDPMSFERAEHHAMRAGLPFRPLAQDDLGRWRWTCTQLLPNGRCGIYEDRPEVCRRYRPGEDPLCVHHWGLAEIPEINQGATPQKETAE